MYFIRKLNLKLTSRVTGKKGRYQTKFKTQNKEKKFPFEINAVDEDPVEYKKMKLFCLNNFGAGKYYIFRIGGKNPRLRVYFKGEIK